MVASRIELIGLIALLLGCALVVVAVGQLAGVALATGVAGAMLMAAGVLLVRLAALTHDRSVK